MSVKKNLTAAALGALLAVPAFGATNISYALHMPSITTHAANVSERQGYFPKGDPRNAIPGADSSHDHNFTKNGHTFDVSSIEQQEANGAQGDIDPIITGVDGNNNLSNAQVIAALEGNSSSSNQNGTDGDSQNSSTQYASNNSLPQTGEVNNQAKRIAASIILGATSVGAGATALAMKHHSNTKSNTYHESVVSGNGHNHKISNIINELRTETSQLQNVTNRIINN